MDIKEDILSLATQKTDILNEDDTVNIERLHELLSALTNVMEISISTYELSLRYLDDLRMQVENIVKEE